MLSSMEFSMGAQQRSNSSNSVACTQRSKENIKREIDRNIRRKTIDKVMRLSEWCNLDPFHEDTLVIIMLLNLKCANKEKLLQRFIECKEEKKAKECKEKEVTEEGDVGDVGVDNLRGFDYRILEHIDTVMPDIMNTVTDWLGILEYVQVVERL